MNTYKEAFVSWLSTFAFTCLVYGLIMLLTSCKNPPPRVDVDFWAGDAKKDGITRAQENRTIACQDAQFDDYVCLSYDDLKELFNAMLQCKSWEKPTMSERDIRYFLIKNQDVVKRVQKQ